MGPRAVSRASATPTIQEALTEFANERGRTLEPSEHYAYRRVLFFLELCINNYGHRNLEPAERYRYERLYHANGGEGRHFFEIFGPKRLLPELDFFTRVYVKTDVFTSERIEERSGPVVDDLSDWLVAKGYVSSADLREARSRARRRRALRARAQRAARLLSERAVAVDRSVFPPRDYIEADDHPIVRVHPGRFWLLVYRSEEPEDIGPLCAPVAVTESLSVGWSLSCALARVCGRWRIVLIDDVYPRV